MLFFPRLARWTLCCILLAVSACEKEPTPTARLRIVNSVPYYHFTEADQPWLQLRPGTEWRFENARGYQRVYSVYQRWEKNQAENRTLVPVGSFVGSSELLNYYDDLLIHIRRTDSIKGGGEFRFHRDAAQLTKLISGGYNKNRSSFYVKGEWSEFVGNTDLISDYYKCRGLKFPDETALEGPFQKLTVRGRQYTEVVEFVGTSRGPACAPVSTSFMQQLYYDRRAGIVRMVSLSGEVWERLP